MNKGIGFLLALFLLIGMDAWGQCAPDQTPPTIICPPTQMMFLDGNCQVNLPDYTSQATVSDACDPNPAVFQSPSPGVLLTGAGTSISVQLVGRDASFNSATCTFTAVTADTTGPVLNCPSNQTLFMSPNCEATLPDYTGMASSTDNCSGSSSIVQSPAPGSTVSGGGSTLVTLTSTDNFNNSSSCTFTVNHVDQTPPTIICPPTQMVFLDGNCQVSLPDFTSQANVSDACDPNPTVFQSPSSGTVFSGAGTSISVQLVGRDASFNSASCTFTATTVDTTAPVLSCPSNQTLFLNSNCQALLPDYTGLASSSDNCTGSPNIVQSPTPGSTITGGGSTLVTLTSTDNSNNSSSCTFTVNHVDQTPPTIVCPSTQMVFLDGNCQASLPDFTSQANSTDACDPNPTVSQSPSPGTLLFGAGASISVQLVGSDASFNSSSCTFTVTGMDTTAPVLSCPGNQVLALNANCQATLPDYTGMANNSDNCGNPSIVQSPAPGSPVSGTGSTLVTLTSTDNSNNSSSCTFTVNHVDQTPPTPICANYDAYLNSNGVATLTAADIDNGSSDNCGNVTLSASATTFGCADAGTQSVTLTVNDGFGNSDSCTSTVTVIDSISPVANCQDVTVFVDGQGNASVLASDLEAGSTDNCGTPTVLTNQFNFTCANLGPNTVNLTVSDANGNSGTCAATVTVADSISPVANCQDITVFLDGQGNASVLASDLDAGSTDNCGTPILLANQFAFTCADIGPNPVSLTVEDGNGNNSSCTGNVTVTDTTPPAAVCQDLTVFLNPNNIANVSTADVDGGSTDNCGISSLSLDSTTFDCDDLGANPVVLSLVDAQGNASQCATTVNVVDSTSPIAVCSSGNLVLDAAGNATLDAATADGGSSDNCGIDSIVYTNPQTYNCSDAGAVATGTLLVYDSQGNVSSCTVNRSVEDEMPPQAICQDDTIYLNAGLAALDANNIDGGSSDNCGIFSVEATPDTFFMADLGTNSVVLMVGDSSGNVDSCLAMVTVLDTTPNAISRNIAELLNLSFFPNPTRGQVVLRWEEAQAYFGETIQVNVSNSLGQTVIRDQWTVTSNREEHSYDLTPYSAGVYVFEFKMSSGKVFHKILRQE